MRFVPAREAGRPLIGERRIIGPWSPEFGCAGIVRQINPSTNLAWASVNDPIAIPFRLSEAVKVTRLGWINGATLTSTNFDIGIYDASWNRLLSTGSTARSGATAWQWVDVTDTVLGPGLYYLVGSTDNASASRFHSYSITTAPAVALAGAQDSATDAFPLPNPLTNMGSASTFAFIPIMGIECTTTVAPVSPATLLRLPNVWIPETLYDNSYGNAIGSLHTNNLANQALYCPCAFPVSCILTSLSFAGNNSTGNYDLGLYDANFKQLAATGSTAMSAAVQTLSLLNIRVKAGSVLYAALVTSSTSARYIGLSMSSLPGVIVAGAAEEASALPLPSTGTPVTPANATHLPLFAFGAR